MAIVDTNISITRIPVGTEASPAMQMGHELLFAELNPDDPPEVRNLQPLLDSSNVALLVAVLGEAPEFPSAWSELSSERYVGALTLLRVQTLTQDLAQIPHVAVDRLHQGRGIGTKLVRRALEECGIWDVSRLELTSGYSKLAAHAMYRQLGFSTRDTLNWRYDFRPQS